jgi:hypothetical protein
VNQIDFNIVENFFKLVYVNNYCCEVRCFNAMVDRRTHWIVRSQEPFTVAGWFTRFDELRCELSRIRDVSCYISVNPIKLGRLPNHAKNNLKILKTNEFCLDSDIAIIRHIIIDIDPVRLPSKSKVNSTNQELFECINVRDNILSDLDLKDKSVYGISGNGAFILIDVSDPKLENNDQTKMNISKFINYISGKYSNKYCVVDTQSANASRMIGLPGSFKYKDIINTTDRPHRRVEIHGQVNDAISVQTAQVVQSRSMDK